MYIGKYYISDFRIIKQVRRLCGKYTRKVTLAKGNVYISLSNQCGWWWWVLSGQEHICQQILVQFKCAFYLSFLSAMIEHAEVRRNAFSDRTERERNRHQTRVQVAEHIWLVCECVMWLNPFWGRAERSRGEILYALGEASNMNKVVQRFSSQLTRCVAQTGHDIASW